MVRMSGTTEYDPAGYSKSPDVSPAQPWRATSPTRLSLPRQPPRPWTRLIPSKAAASDHHYLPRGWLDESPTARSFLTRPPTGTPRRAISPGEGLPIFPASPSGKQPDCPSLRASDEHRFIVRVLRARRMVWLSPPVLLSPRVARAQGTHQANTFTCWRTFSASCYEAGGSSCGKSGTFFFSKAKWMIKKTTPTLIAESATLKAGQW